MIFSHALPALVVVPPRRVGVDHVILNEKSASSTSGQFVQKYIKVARYDGKVYNLYVPILRTKLMQKIYIFGGYGLNYVSKLF